MYKCSKGYMCGFGFANHDDDDNRLGFWFGLAVWGLIQILRKFKVQ